MLNPNEGMMLPQTLPSSIKRFEPRPRASLRLFCFPYAGGGASVYRRWAQYLPGTVELLAVQLPGREDRFREPAYRRVEAAVEMLARDLEPQADRPFVFWGHSMGALIAYELTRSLRSAGRPCPRRLMVSGRQAPQLPEPLPPIPDLADEPFVAELQKRYGGVPEAIARDPEIRAVFLPTIRADLELVNTYVHQPGAPLACGISAFGGTHDAISRSDLEAWKIQTTADFRLHVFPGDHFYLNTQTEALLPRVVEDLREVLASL